MDRPVHLPPREAPNPRQHQDDAAALIRQQIAQIYDSAKEPTVTQPIQAQPPQAQPQSVPQTYQQVYRDTPSEPDWQTYHSAWQSYYQQYYHRYYLHQLHAQRQQVAATPAQPQASSQAKQPYEPPKETVTGRVDEPDTAKREVKKIKSRVRQDIEERATKLKKSPHFKPIMSGVVVGLLFLIVQFNSIIAADFKLYVSPGTATDQGGSIIIDPTSTASVGPNPEIIIPKIGVDVPVVYGVTSYDNTAIEDGLENGVVHYGLTSYPGQIGNDVIVGHSSNEIYAPGNYKFAFVLLSDLNSGDIIELNYQGVRYVYQVYNKAVVSPNDFSLVDIAPTSPVLTLITCTPAGTSLNRLIIQAKQISPNPSTAAQSIPQNSSNQAKPTTLPGGNEPTVLDRVTSLF